MTRAMRKSILIQLTTLIRSATALRANSQTTN